MSALIRMLTSSGRNADDAMMHARAFMKEVVLALENMADVKFDPENTNTEELRGQGIRAFVLQDYETAVQIFSKASELLAKEHANDLHDSLGDIYLYYGRALLELSRKESTPLGDAVIKTTEDQSGDEDGDDDEDAAAEEEDEEEAAEGGGGEAAEAKPSDEEPAKDDAEKEDGEGDDLSDLQVAWEVLELAKKILEKRGESGRKMLAETYVALGEVSLETGNYVPAIEDITAGLKIQKELFGCDSRIVAETLYKLAVAHSSNAEVDEAIENFLAASEYLRNRLTTLKADEVANKDEIEELNSLLPELAEKVADMKDFKVEMAKKVAEAAQSAAKTNGDAGGPSGSSSSSSTSKQVTNISHLVKRKRKPEDDDSSSKDETPAKKPSP